MYKAKQWRPDFLDQFFLTVGSFFFTVFFLAASIRANLTRICNPTQLPMLSSFSVKPVEKQQQEIQLGIQFPDWTMETSFKVRVM